MTEHLVVHQFDPEVAVAGGIDGFIRDLVALAPPEHELALVGVDTRGRHRLGRWSTAVVGDRPVRFMPVARLDPGDQRRSVPHTVRLAAGLLRYRPRVGASVLHSHRAETGALLTTLHPRARHVQFVHGDALAALEQRSETFWRFAPRAYLALERLAVRRSALTVVMSRTAAERLGGERARVRVGRNWFDGRRFHPDGPAPSAVPVLGWAGRMEPPKDPLRAVETLAELRRRGVGFSAWMAGEGTLGERVRRDVAERSLPVELPGFVDADALAGRLRSTDVLLMSSRFEGFPRIAVEALACGVPVVAPDVGELPAVVVDGRNGFLSRSGDADELATLVERALELRRGPGLAQTVAGLEGRRVVAELLADAAG